MNTTRFIVNLNPGSAVYLHSDSAWAHAETHWQRVQVAARARGDSEAEIARYVPWVEETRHVEVIHARHNWAYWSDGRLTPWVRGVDHATLPKRLSYDADRLLTVAHGSDSGTPTVGWAHLAGVHRITRRTDLLTDETAPGGYAGLKLEWLEVLGTRRFDPDAKPEPRDLYVITRGYSEGYRFHAVDNLRAALSLLELSAEEEAAVYDRARRARLTLVEAPVVVLSDRERTLLEHLVEHSEGGGMGDCVPTEAEIAALESRGLIKTYGKSPHQTISVVREGYLALDAARKPGPVAFKPASSDLPHI